MLSCCRLLFYLLGVAAFTKVCFGTKRRLAKFLTWLLVVLHGCRFLGDPVAGLAHFVLSLVRVAVRKRPKNRSWKMRIHRKLKPWKLRWCKLHAPVGHCVVEHSVDGDCAFVSFAQGLKQHTILCGARKLRKLAYSRLRRFAKFESMWDGLSPQEIPQSCSWHDYLHEIQRPGAWGSEVEICALAESFAVNSTIFCGSSMKTFSVKEPKGHIWLQLESGHFSCLSQKEGKQRAETLQRKKWWNTVCQAVFPSKFSCSTSMWRGGSMRATKRKQQQRNSVKMLRNLQLPDQLKFLTPLIPMLVDLLSNYQPAKKVKPKKPKTSGHPSKQLEQRTDQTTSKEPCWYHLNGGCRFGNKCYFSHDKQNPSPQKASAVNKTDTSRQQPDKAIPKAWDLRPSDWDGEIFSITGFSNKLDCIGNNEDLKAIVKVDHEYDLQDLREMLPEPLSDKIQILAVQPCLNPQQAAAELLEITYAPVRMGAVMKPRALILHRITGNCNFGLKIDKTKELTAKPVMPETIVMRIAVEKRFVTDEVWNKIKEKPGRAARQWAEARLGMQNAKKVHDTWNFTEKYFKSPVLLGLLRVDKAMCSILTSQSGVENFFCEPLNWQQSGQEQNPAIKWFPQADDESTSDYLARALAEKPPFGVTRGEKQLGLRLTRDPAQSFSKTWTIQGVPSLWSQETVEHFVKEDLKLEDAQCISKRTERKGKHTWIIRATSKSAQDFFQLKHDDTYITAYVNTVRGGAVRTGKSFSNPRSVTFSRFDAAEFPPLASTRSEASKSPGDTMDVSEENRSKAQKHGLSPQKNQQPAKKPAWCNEPPPHMTRVANKGGGDCLFLAAAEGINKLTKREKPLTHRMLRASVCKHLQDRSRSYEPFWDGKEPSLEEASCESWTTYIEKLRRVGSWGGHLEVHAIAQLYNVQIHVLTAGGFCATAMEQGETGLHLWHKDKHYELLTGAHPEAWIKEATALGYTGGRSGGKSCRSTVQSCEIDSVIFSKKLGKNSAQPSRVASHEIDSGIFAKSRRAKQAHSNAVSRDLLSSASKRTHVACAIENLDTDAEIDSPSVLAADGKPGCKTGPSGWKCPICALYLKPSTTLPFRRHQHLKQWHPEKMHEYVRVSRWQPRTPDEQATWKCKYCDIAIYGSNKSDWQMRMDHWKTVHPKKPKEDFLLGRGRPTGTSMRIPTVAKRNALVSKNLQLLKGDLNGHDVVEVVWPFAPKEQGVVKKFICKRCLRTAHLSKVIKSKCTGKRIKDKRRMRLLRSIRNKIGKTKSLTAKDNLQQIADLYATCQDTSHRSKTCEAVLRKQRSRG